MKRTLALALLLASIGSAARAEVAEVRFSRNIGLGYLQVYLLEDLKLVEKHAKAQGIDVAAKYTQIPQAGVINDTLISGKADFGVAGFTPFITLWDKTRGSLEVKALAALNAQPVYLNTNNPAIRSLKDFSDKDRIAVPVIKVSFQAIILQMAAEQAFGSHDKLDSQTVGLPHPEATAALLSGRTEITAHFTSPPYQYQQLAHPGVHRVLSSYDVTGGVASFSGIWTTRAFYDGNPKVVRAVFSALEEATDLIRKNPRQAAEIYVRLDNTSKQTVDEVEKLLKDPEIVYDLTPKNVTKFTDFMARTGGIKKAPQDWKELFFPIVHEKAGS